ncbi:F-box domain containing protein [Pandoravirus macleodensis]|uniref:F-box domain containing protein n=1 Tax=Pandoravirus macleodensis TaxID=2107707 RepID=A0A2U7UFD6_9VIRU|nr:F-box domain containing protein [Pandoravirus macleodensis]AVK77189.1 F-box domain containing protein [Pandoravirus macleodensis]UMO79909.1 F-box domain containing protein [Pandoravirus aubagnensis]
MWLDSTQGDEDSLFGRLPDEMLAHVLALLSCLDRVRCALSVCRRWRALVSDPTITEASSCFVVSDSSTQDGRRLKMCLRAVGRGHVECMLFARTAGCDRDNHIYCAAIKWDKVDCVRALDDHGGRFCPDDLADLSMETASANCLDYALGRSGTIWTTSGCDWHCRSNDASAHAACIRILRNHNARPRWRAANDAWTHPCASAAVHGHLDCLRYARENGCPMRCLYMSRSRIGRSPRLFALCPRKLLGVGRVHMRERCRRGPSRLPRVRTRERTPVEHVDIDGTSPVVAISNACVMRTTTVWRGRRIRTFGCGTEYGRDMSAALTEKQYE